MQIVAAWLLEESRDLAELEGCPLTRRQREVAGLIAVGRTNCEIASDLVIATSTTERHVANILSKLDMHSRVQIAGWAIQHGLKATPRELKGYPAREFI